jgi:tRNA-dihydrouridine synthase
MMHFWQQLPQPFFILAPMEAVTDVVFRHVVARAAAPDVWFSEFTNATGWVHAGEKAVGGRLLKTDDEQPIVAQIWGGEPGDMEQLAGHCRELGYHGIDINMGCPAKSAVKSGGSALIRQPDLAAASIAAAKTAGLPVSVKTRLGYTHVDEWHEWLAHLLRQDIVNLTIHLRTKKEMSKVPAHYELIPDIVALRDEIAPQTLLTINGDIENRAHGEKLLRENPGVNGAMIGRGVFHDPFCFRKNDEWRMTNDVAKQRNNPLLSGAPAQARERAAIDSRRSEDCLSPSKLGASSAASIESSVGLSLSAEAVPESKGLVSGNRKQELIHLLYLHLDLFDHYQPQLKRPFETLKRFFKIYIREFDGASELRHELMQTKSTDEVRAVLLQYSL